MDVCLFAPPFDEFVECAGSCLDLLGCDCAYAAEQDGLDLLPNAALVGRHQAGGLIGTGLRDQNPGESDDHRVESACTGPGREGGHRRGLDLAVEGRVEVLEVLVVGAVAGAGRVEHDRHQARMGAADPAGGLDVFGSGLRLAHHGHQAEAVHVHAHSDHVGGQQDVHGILVGPTLLDPLEAGGDFACVDTARQLRVVGDGARLDVLSGGKQIEVRQNVIVNLELGSRQQTEAVEVADEAPVRVLYLVLGLCLLRPVQEGGIGTDEEGGLAGSGSQESHVAAGRLLLARGLHREPRVARV